MAGPSSRNGIRMFPGIRSWAPLPATKSMRRWCSPTTRLGHRRRRFARVNSLTQEDCMLELGMNNVLGMLRTDTLYAAHDPKIKAAKECQDAALPCIEVMLELSSFWTRSTDSGVALLPRPFGTEPPQERDHYGGYVITDGSTYAPQMPWYMAHYCDSHFAPTANDVQDPACYGDYLSPMNNGFNPIGLGATDWPRSVPWSVFPATASGAVQPLQAGGDKVHAGHGGIRSQRGAVESGHPSVHAIQREFACLVQRGTDQLSQRPQPGRASTSLPLEWNAHHLGDVSLPPGCAQPLSGTVCVHADARAPGGRLRRRGERTHHHELLQYRDTAGQHLPLPEAVHAR